MAQDELEDKTWLRLVARLSGRSYEQLRVIAIPITNQKPDRFRPVRQRPRQLPRLLDDPWPAWIRRATGEMHTTAAQLDKEENVKALQPDCLDREEIDGQQTLTMCPDEFAPGHFRPFARRPETSGAEPPAHGRR